MHIEPDAETDSAMGRSAEQIRDRPARYWLIPTAGGFLLLFDWTLCLDIR